MSRYIDADTLWKQVNSLIKPSSTEGAIIFQQVLAMIEDAHAVDAIPIVRCKDCKHNQLPPTSGNADCELWYGMTDLYGYCHCGERRKDAKTD